ncbi:MAG: hypothetical protein KJ592_01365 [Nanoarchaeota archaeon]|nr:hypothetical protein [Nanoarchaeota archaeon]
MKVAITSNAFSKNDELVSTANNSFEEVKLNHKVIKTNKELIEFIKDSDAIILGGENINDDVLKNSPKLRYISKYGVGVENIDFESCKKYNVKVLHTKGTNKRSVAELTIGYMLGLMRNIYQSSLDLKNREWNKNGGFNLSSKTIGIIGVGNIGKEVVELLKNFNCKILVNDIIEQEEYYKQNNLIQSSKEEIFKTSDIVTVHVPLDSSTENLINKETLEKMKPSSFIINTSRGKVINEEDLISALRDGKIKGAALDVYSNEPFINEELIKQKNLYCTPHIGGASNESILSMGHCAIEMLKEVAKKNLSKELEIAIYTAKKTGDYLKKIQKVNVITESARDIKIDSDKEAEKIILSELSKTNIPIISEESHHGELILKGLTWIVDPIDGSLNFLRKIPNCVVSIALFDGLNPLLGIIYDFNREEMYYGDVNNGAFINGKKINVSDTPSKDKAILCSGIAKETEHSKENLEIILNSFIKYKKLRFIGSAALSLGYVAAGKVDAYSEKNILLWDVAAGLALVKASNGFIDFKQVEGLKFDVFASNGKIME